MKIVIMTILSVAVISLQARAGTPGKPFVCTAITRNTETGLEVNYDVSDFQVNATGNWETGRTDLKLAAGKKLTVEVELKEFPLGWKMDLKVPLGNATIRSFGSDDSAVIGYDQGKYSSLIQCSPRKSH